MRTLIITLLFAAACHHEWTMADDLGVFCGPEAAKHVGTGGLHDFGPWAEANLRTPEMHAMLDRMKNGSSTIPEMQTFVEKQLAAAKIQSCPTMEALFGKKPPPPATP